MALLDLKRLTGAHLKAYARLEADAPLPADGAVLLPLDRMAQEGPGLQERTAPVGLLADTAAKAADIEPHLSRVELVAVAVPGFKDGRVFSLARRLRDDLGFNGEIRALGHLLPDQAEFLARSGVTSVEIDADDVDAFVARLTSFSLWYQDARDARPTVLELRHGRTRKRLAS